MPSSVSRCFETALDLTDFARGQAFGAVVGVGGGSAMDMAKLAAALATNAGGVKDYLGVVTFPKAPLPLALVPTTAGTGAEATSVSMLSIEGRKSIVLSSQLIPHGGGAGPLSDPEPAAPGDGRDRSGRPKPCLRGLHVDPG